LDRLVGNLRGPVLRPSDGHLNGALALGADSRGAALGLLRRRRVGRVWIDIADRDLPQKFGLLRPLPLDRVAVTLHEVIMREREGRRPPALREVKRAVELG